MSRTANTEERFVSDDERSDIESSAFLLRDPVSVHLYESLDGLNVELFVHLRDAESVVCSVRSLGIHVRSEQLNLAFRSFVSLETFEHFLSIMENNCSRIQLKRSVRDDSSVVPAFAIFVFHDEHVVSEFCTESQSVRIRLCLGFFCFCDWKIVFHGVLL